MNDKKFQKLLHVPLPLKISDKTPWLAIALIGATWFFIFLRDLRDFVVAGYALHRPVFDTWSFWNLSFSIFISVVVLLTALWFVIFPKKEKALIITAEGFTITGRDSQKTYQWNNTTEFQAGFSSAKRGYIVTFNDHSGNTYELLENYRLTDYQLAQLLNHWRERAIGANNR